MASSPRSLTDRLFAPVDIASLVFFRIVFGALMLWEVWYYYSSDLIRQLWIEPSFHFKYYGFEWVKAWPGDGMYWHFGALAVLALFLMLGLFYRVSAVLFCIGFTYTFLIEQARYLNHYYMMCLMSFLLIWLPAHRSFSLDARRRPGLRSSTTPAWTLLLLQAQFGIVYFFGGVAKINPDWLRGEPMRTFLLEDPFLGPLHGEWMTYFFAYGGLLLDLFIVPALIWKRTRTPAFLVALAFHVSNSMIFKIDVFPWFMIAGTALFLPPSWPRTIVGWFREHGASDPAAASAQPEPPSPLRQRLVLSGLGGYLAIQLLLPLRPYLYPGQTLWTDEGQRFSWRMMLRRKEGETFFVVADGGKDLHAFIDPRHFMSAEQALAMYRDPEAVAEFGRSLVNDWAAKQGWTNVAVTPLPTFLRFTYAPAPGEPRKKIRVPEYLSLYQQRKMSWYADFPLQFAHHVAETKRKELPQIQVFCEAWVALNGRPHQLLMDPDVDLAARKRTLGHQDWLLPLNQPLPEPGS